MLNKPQIRKFIRHPSDVPIRVTLGRAADESDLHPCKQLNNVSLGGLAFFSNKDLSVGDIVSVRFPTLDSHHLFSAEVVWRRPHADGWEIGIHFDDPDELYSLRMIEQVCHIEHYRNEVRNSEGRQLTTEQAAKEWVGRYASKFPAIQS